jgi:ectoine hydroxylase-related dioxygenase (phytanoyl-CoA dioxygenase family)
MSDEMGPVEFSRDGVDEASTDAFIPYAGFLRSGEPYLSIFVNNPWLLPPKADAELEWGQGWYYDTTVARKHEYWRDIVLPTPTKDLQRLRHDLYEWGFCLIEDGLSNEQCRRIRQRVADQAAAERALGIAYLVESQQHVWSLVNKGADFIGFLEHDPAVVQAGPMIERLLDETLGPGWHHFSLLANISYPGCHPQPMHQDQTWIAPIHTHEAPVLVNTMYVLQDVDEHNGGTLLVPGAHRANGAPETGLYGPLPKPINLEAPAGTVLMFDGRLLHGGAVNHSDDFRYVLTNSCVKPWARQQENFALGMSPEVLANASDKLLWRTGLQSSITTNLVEGYGYRGSGRQGDDNGSLRAVRREFDRGYRHVGELSMATLESVDLESLSLVQLQRQHEDFRDERHAELMSRLDSSRSQET